MEKVPNELGGRWHKKRTYGGGYLTVTGAVTGCGLAQMYGVSSYTLDSLKKELVKISADYKEDGAGGIICTLGQPYYTKGARYEQMLLDAGFELLTEYDNHRHGRGYKQRIYIYKIK